MVDVVSIVVGIISLIIGIIGAIYTYKAYIKERALKTISWDDIQNGVRYIWKKLKKIEFVPDIMISPDPKSGIIAFTLAQYFDKDILIDVGQAFRRESTVSQMFSDECYTVVKTNKWKVLLSKQLECIQNKENVKILVVDDFILSGDFNTKLIDFLIQQGYKEENIIVCCLAVTKVAISSAKSPNYSWKTVDDEDFYFPWGKAE